MAIITTDYGLTKPPPGCSIDYGHTINLGLVGYWMFNEKGGTRLTDYSGYGNHGTLTNFALSGATSNWVGSPMGGGLKFDGTNDYVVIPQNITPVGDSSRSISIWFKCTTTISTRQWLVYAGAESAADPTRFCLEIEDSKFVFNYNAQAVKTSNILANTWYNGVVTYNSDSKVLSLFLNGKFQTSFTFPYGLSLLYLVTPTTVNTYFGIFTNTTSFPFNGVMDGMRFYNRCLNTSEISQLYTQPNIGLLTPTYYTQS